MLTSGEWDRTAADLDIAALLSGPAGGLIKLAPQAVQDATEVPKFAPDAGNAAYSLYKLIFH